MNQFILAGIVVALATAFSFLIEPVTGYLSVALFYLLLVVAVGLRLGRGPVLTVAATSALLWNFLFIPPRLTFYIENVHDGMMFAMFFVVAVAMGHLTGRLRLSEMAERRRERRSTALYELAHQAAFAPELDTGLRAAVGFIESIFEAKPALFLRMADHTLSKVPHAASSFSPSEREQGVATCAFSRKIPVGRFTDTLPDSEALHLPLQARTAVMGVLSVLPAPGHTFDLSERELLEAFAVLIGLLLEKDHITEALKRAEILEASERLRRSVLDSVSHELKTPLAAVQTGLAVLEQQTRSDEGSNLTLGEMQTAVRRLNRVINSLLDMTRIEAGVVQPRLDWSDVEELVRHAIELACESLAGHELKVEIKDNLAMVKIDHALVEQTLCNLLVNAANWSEQGTTITVRADLVRGGLVLAVLDRGPGIDPADMAHIFEKFYRGSMARPGGTGLGLSIVDGFTRAHGGTVVAANREDGGAQFEIRLPVETVSQKVLESMM